jgi:hypothetical protein
VVSLTGGFLRGSAPSTHLRQIGKRKDNSPLDTKSDGYATGLVAFALEQTGAPQAQAALKRAILWLSQNQDPSDGRWPASSLNKQRELSSDAGRFMSDAATYVDTEIQGITRSESCSE